MVFDTRVSSEQTVKQQEHVLQGVAQMVMNMETECVQPPAKASSDVSGYFRECFTFAESFPANNKTSGTKLKHLYGPTLFI